MTTNNSIDAVGFPPLSVSLGGTNLISTIANNLLYSSATGVIANLATANNSVLITSGTGVPSIASTLPSAVQANITQLGNLTTLTVGSLTLSGVQIASTGAINLAASGGAGVGVFGGNLGINAGGSLLLYNAASTFYSGFQAQVGQASNITYSLPLTLPANTGSILTSTSSGGLSWTAATYPSSTTINQILYSSAANTVTGLAAINSSVLITGTGGIPVYVTPSATQTVVGIAGAAPGVANIPGLNLLINGDFQIWQRSTGGSAVITVPASTTQYTADRWQIVTGASQICTVNQATGGGYVLSGSYLAWIQRNAGQTGTTAIKFGQSLTRDMCSGVAGNSITISFSAAPGLNYSASGNILTVSLITGTGTTDISGISGTAYIGSVTQSANVVLTMTPSLQNFTATFAVGSTVTQMCVVFSFVPTGTAAASDNFVLTNVQTEISPNATPFQGKTWAQDSFECKFFYQKSFTYQTLPAANIGVNTNETIVSANKGGGGACASNTIGFEREMFAIPTMTYFSPAVAASIQAYDETATNTCTATVTRYVTAKGFAFNYTNAPLLTGAVGDVIGVHWTAETELT